MSCRWTTGLAKTPTRIRTRNSSFEARDDHPFHHRGNSGRQGSRTLISVGRTALAERPGQPYPATFRSGRACVSRSLVVSERETQATVSPCSQGSGDRTHALQRPKLADCRFPIPRQWTAGDLNPDLRRAKPASSLWTSSPNQRTIVAWMWARSLRRWTTGPTSSRGGSRTHNHSPGSRPGRFAVLRTRPFLLDVSRSQRRSVRETQARRVAEAGFEPASNGL